ncbi:class A beta-lactamase [Pseudonocardiaceae bacterium YIM PH 21723]|nr:class A beta-lactamase [Pseudonocardiaceae bacterium YIM PH 21723]
MLDRRAAILGGLGAAFIASTGTANATTITGTAWGDLVELERGFGGRIGVSALDTGNGRTVRYRSRERFMSCSTHKVLTVAAVLQARHQQPGLLDRVIHYTQADCDASGYAEITKRHVNEGMTVRELCDAAIRYSDNCADNLLFQLVDGPAGVTRYVRGLGDRMTRLDRIEPELNKDTGDDRDTTTPLQIGETLRWLTLGDKLDPVGRGMLNDWMIRNTTGGDTIRKGLPVDWTVVGDKTGTGTDNERNDIAVLWPPNRAPWIITVFTDPDDPKSTKGNETIEKATAIVVKHLR